MKIYSINISKKKGQPKQPTEKAVLIENYGIQGDAHAGMKVCQVSLLAKESIEKSNEVLRQKNEQFLLSPGAFAENLTTEGVVLSDLKIGDCLLLQGGAVLEISQKGKTCHGKCSVFYRVGDCIMPRECVFAVVKKAGIVEPGNEMTLVKKEKVHESLPVNG